METQTTKKPSKTINIFFIEIEKLIKRKEWIILLALGGISILFASAIFTDSYVGATNQSAIYWVCSQIFNSSALFISPMVCAFIAARTLAGEIENGSILLYTYRFRNKQGMYVGKNLALSCFVALVYLVVAIINLWRFAILWDV